jgi:hypothetical protein
MLLPNGSSSLWLEFQHLNTLKESFVIECELYTEEILSQEFVIEGEYVSETCMLEQWGWTPYFGSTLGLSNPTLPWKQSFICFWVANNISQSPSSTTSRKEFFGNNDELLRLIMVPITAWHFPGSVWKL